MNSHHPFHDDTIHSPNRLGFALCVAGALHAALILGITFDKDTRAAVSQQLEITLAQFSSPEPPDKADFIAHANQQGSGTLEEAKELTTQHIATLQDNHIKDSDPTLQELGAPDNDRLDARLAARIRSNDTTSRATQPAPRAAPLNETQLTQLSQEIASLEAKLDMQRQAYAKRPRVRRLTSQSTKQADDALYLHQWRSKVETIGNLNYPQQAKLNNIYGELRLMVALLPNGAVHEVKILKSSGQRILDEAALRIVYLAAPYPAFPSSMAKTTDILEIIRTWRFEENRLLSER